MTDPTLRDELSLDHRIRETIREIPDFPKEGILFKDITTVLRDGPLFSEIIVHLAERYRGDKVKRIIGIESRGFIFGAALAHELRVGFSMVRKAGKLPHHTIAAAYELEYGTDTVEIHADAIDPGDPVVVVDDLLATGGTCAATLELLEELQADVVEAAFLVELQFLNGRARLSDHSVYSITAY